MDQMLASIQIFAGNFAPRSWAFCDGQLMSIAQNTALFSLLGTTYGGDGRTTFALPDLRGRVPIGPRRGPGLSNYVLGQRSGQELAYLNTLQIPSHTHNASATATDVPGSTVPINATATVHADSTGATSNPAGKFLAKPGDISLTEVKAYGDTADVTLNAGAVTVDGTVDLGNIPAPNVSVTVFNSGGSQGHNNMQPFLALNYIIAIQGYFPSRN